jgi:hypothetical protein
VEGYAWCLDDNVEMGEHVTKQILNVHPDNASSYVLLSNIYAAAGNRVLSASIQQ